ncbi:MAG TPA: Gfo/Idh/MocA family oxidoreductase [Aquihabitans sp.]|jgi:predicted dehydrogenase|nr:Gfo/Idh/MocA family oxidoreductase [Aquihabitans sp.]
MRPETPASVAVSGCGAVAREYHGPALQALQADGVVRVVGAHDPDGAAAGRFCAAFPGARATTDLDALLAASPALLVVASPPQHHAEQAIAAMEAGIDVLCEKPLAPTVAEGERMVAVAEATGRTLAVAMVRRQLPATRAIRQLLATQAIGPLVAVECFEGGPFDWPVGSPAWFRPPGGGVLQDIGVHCLDLLSWWLGPPTSVAYEDDAMGGTEANCRISLTHGDVPATVRLSRDWARPNRYVFRGRDGSLGWTVNEADDLDLELAATGLVGDVRLRPALPTPGRSAADRSATDRLDPYRRAFADQLLAIVAPADEGPASVPGAEALGVLALLERCAADRRALPMPWLVPGGTP